MKNSDFNVGDVVIALNTMGESACGDHPALIYCKADEELVIREVCGEKSYWDFQVSHADVTDKTFGVGIQEIRLKLS